MILKWQPNNPMKSHCVITTAITLSLLLSFAPPVLAEIKPDSIKQDQPISLSDALDIADKNNPQNIIAKKAVDIAAAGIDIAKEIPNPQLFVQNNFGPFVSLGVQNLVGVTQTVELAGKRGKRTRLAKSQYELTIAQLNAIRWSTREQTRQAYATYVTALATKEVIETLEETARNLMNIAQIRLDAGASPEADVVQARLTLSQIITQKNQALSQIKQARLALNTLLGKSLLNDGTPGYTVNDYGLFKLGTKTQTQQSLSPTTSQKSHVSSQINQPEFVLNTPLGKAVTNGVQNQVQHAFSQVTTQENQILSQLDKSLSNNKTIEYTAGDDGVFTAGVQKTKIIPSPDAPALDINPLYERALKIRPDLIAAIQQVKANQDQITLLKAQKVPDPQISPSYNYLKVNIKDIPASQAGRQYLQGGGLQVSFPLPIFHNMGPELRQAQATLDQSQRQVEATIVQLRNDIRTAYLAYELDRENIGVYEQKLIPDAKEALSLTQEGYKYGKYPLVNVILAQQNYSQIFQSYLQAVSNFQSDWGSLEQAVGEPLPL